MTEQTREMMLRLADGASEVLPILHIMHNHYARCDEMLRWLIRNQISGRDMVLMVRYQHSNSPLEFFKWLTAKLDHDNELRPMFIGNQYKL